MSSCQTNRPCVPVAGIPVAGVAVVSILPPCTSRCLFGGDETVTVCPAVQCSFHNRCKSASAYRLKGLSSRPACQGGDERSISFAIALLPPASHPDENRSSPRAPDTNQLHRRSADR